MKKFNQFAGKTIDSISQNDDGNNPYFIIKFTDGAKMNIVGYISDDVSNKINLKAKTYESDNNSKLYIEESITDFMKKTKKIDESFINITVNIGKDDVLTTSNNDVPPVNTLINLEDNYDEIDGEEDGESEDLEYDEEYDETEDLEYGEEDGESEDLEYDEEYDETEDLEYDEEDDVEESYIDSMGSMEDQQQWDDELDYDEEDYDDDDIEEDEEFDEDEDFDEVDAESINNKEEVIEDEDEDEEVIGTVDIETILSNQLLSPEFNRENFEFKDEKSEQYFSGIVLGKLSGGYFLFKTEEGIKKVHIKNVIED